MTSISAVARHNAVFSLTNLAVSIVSSIAVARLLTTTAYADYTTMMAIVTWMLLLSETGGGIGFARHLKSAESANSRLTFYRAFTSYRWKLTPIIILVLVIAGPYWARQSHLDTNNWSWPVFLILGMTVSLSLQGQLGHFALISGFKHARALLITQSSSIAKALLIILVVAFYPDPAVMAATVLAATLLAALLYWRSASGLFAGESAPLPAGIMAAAHRHGLVTILDKITTAIGSGPFLLIVLAGVYSRPEMALLALSTDFLQKLLAVVNLPMGNMVMPYLHRWQDTAEFPNAQARTATLGILVFIPAIGGILTCSPFLVPLLFGDKYAGAIILVLISAIPMFLEALVRMIWGFTLIASKDYRFIIITNILQAVLALTLLLATAREGIATVLLAQGALQLAIATAILWRAAKHGLLTVGVSLPALTGVVFAATFAGATAGEFANSMGGGWAAVLCATIVNIAVVAFGLRTCVSVDADTLQAITRLAGPRAWLVVGKVLRARHANIRD